MRVGVWLLAFLLALSFHVFLPPVLLSPFSLPALLLPPVVVLDSKPVPSNHREYLHRLSAHKRRTREREGASSPPPLDQAQTQQTHARSLSALHSTPSHPYKPKVLTRRHTPS